MFHSTNYVYVEDTELRQKDSWQAWAPHYIIFSFEHYTLFHGLISNPKN